MVNVHNALGEVGTGSSSVRRPIGADDSGAAHSEEQRRAVARLSGSYAWRPYQNLSSTFNHSSQTRHGSARKGGSKLRRRNWGGSGAGAYVATPHILTFETYIAPPLTEVAYTPPDLGREHRVESSGSYRPCLIGCLSRGLKTQIGNHHRVFAQREKLKVAQQLAVRNQIRTASLCKFRSAGLRTLSPV